MFQNDIVFKTRFNDFEEKRQKLLIRMKASAALNVGNLVSTTDGINCALFSPTAAVDFTSGTVYGIVCGNFIDPSDNTGNYYMIALEGMYISDAEFATNVTASENRGFAYQAMNAQQVYKNYPNYNIATFTTGVARLMASF